MTNEEATIDQQAAEKRLAEMNLKPAPSSLLGLVGDPGGPMLGKAGTMYQPPQPTHPPAPNRKPRSDKGVPKKPAAAATLTIQFDLSDNEGRELFAKTLKFWAENGAMEAVKQIAEQFAKKVDAISRAK